MEDTKTRICNTAVRLFDEKGYDNVSLREIAEAAGTTIGNLTYHFAQKEHLLAAVAKIYQEDFLPQFVPATTNSERLRNVVITFFRAQENEQRAPVYYKNVFEFAKSSTTLEERNIRFRKSLYEYYHDIFSVLRNDGVFRDDVTVQDVEVLSYSIVFFASLWIQNASPYYDPDLPKIPLAEALCSILRQYLAETYHNEFTDICKVQKGLLKNE